MEDEAFTIDEFKARYKVGHTTTFQEIKSGRLVVARIGRKVLVPKRRADEWLAAHERIPEAAKAA